MPTRSLLVAAAVSTLIFAALTPMAWHTARVGRVDHWVLDAGFPTHSAVFDLGRAMSFLGSGAIVAIIALRVAFHLWRRERRPSLALATIGGVSAAGIAEFVAKKAIARPRPSTAALTGRADFGFPSGHTTGATALAATAIALLYIVSDTVAGLAVGTVFASLAFVAAVQFDPARRSSAPLAYERRTR